MKKTIDGIIYDGTFADFRLGVNPCTGCAGRDADDLCEAFGDCLDPENVIWRATDEVPDNVVTVRLVFKEGTSREEAEEAARDIIYDGLRTAPAPHPVSWRIEK